MLTVNYYDNYNFLNPLPSFLNVETQPVLNNTTKLPKGLPTGGWVRTLQNGTTVGETSYILYDEKGRPVRARTTNYLGGYTQSDSKLDFDGTITRITKRHKRLSTDPNELLTTEEFTYNEQDRLVSHTHKVGTSGIPQLMSYNIYNEIGQLILKKVGGTDVSGSTALQFVNYSYNVRGWLEQINNVNGLTSATGSPQDLFALKINYSDNIINDINNKVVPLYNGNIAETSWSTSSDNIQRRYGYTYDRQNRLTDAWYQMPGAATAVRNSYDEHQTYDFNGNILTLSRNGEVDNESLVTEIDDLTYTYDSTIKNRLIKVVDNTPDTHGFNNGTSGTANDFTYDLYGNLQTDKNKGITTPISCNHLNLPVAIAVNNGVQNGTISYLYNADGVKLKKTVTPSGGAAVTTEYLGGYQYRAGVLDFFPTSEGYVKNTFVNGTNNYNYVFNYKDHLGNVRVSYTVDPVDNVLKIIEENHYYPFGLKHSGYNANQNILDGRTSGPPVVLTPVINPSDITFKYKFNGMEFQNELGLNLYDFGARNYDPAIGRWMNIDPLASKYFSFSPYQYVLNNPVYFVDVDGMQATPGEGDPNKPIQLQEVVINVTRAKSNSSNSSNFAWVGKLVPDINLGYAFFGKDLYKSYDKVFASEDGRQFYKNLHKYDDTEKAIYLTALSIVVPELAIELIAEAGTVAVVAEEVAILEAVGQEGVVAVVELEEATVAVAEGGTKLLTQGVKPLHKHHTLPQQFRKWFESRGIKNIDDYTVEISQSNHLKGVHGNGSGSMPGKWNKLMGEFIEANPNATPSEIFYHTEGLLQRFGLEHLPYVPY